MERDGFVHKHQKKTMVDIPIRNCRTYVYLRLIGCQTSGFRNELGLKIDTSFCSASLFVSGSVRVANPNFRQTKIPLVLVVSTTM